MNNGVDSQISILDNFNTNYKKISSVIIPFFVVNIIWFFYFYIHDLFYLFSEKSDSGLPRWIMPIVMLFGSMVAGATSEGGGSIAFPVMTLGLNISPIIARDFSFMIQSVGMSSASFSILFMYLKLEYKSIVYSSLGGIIGIIIGLEYIVNLIPTAFSKIYFVTIWGAFAFQLFLLNRDTDRICFLNIQNYEKKKHENILILFITGIIGGILSSISGSGIDICVFSVLTLLFRLNEKVAVPTSVILMSLNTIFGFIYRGLVQSEISKESWKYFAVCIPVVVLGAPLGALISSHLNRNTISYLIYFTDFFQLVTAYIIIQPWNIDLFLTLLSPVIFVFFCLLFYYLSYLGEKNIEEIDCDNQISIDVNDV